MDCLSVFAGSGKNFHDDGPALTASFDHPYGMVFDKKGIMFVTEENRDCIRRIENGIVTTFAGSGYDSRHADGSGTNARFNAPRAIAIDEQENMYVGDTLNYVVRMISKDG